VSKRIYATWCISNNIGDLLTPWLIEKITGQTPIYMPYDVKCPKYMVSGSILNHATDYTIVWGAGFANSQDCLSKGVDVRAVRGPVTAQRIKFQAGVDCQVWGDPALLMPDLYKPQVEKKYKVGICPHYAHQREVIDWFAGREDIKFINVFSTPEQFVIDVLECETILSSSLHGLIIAHAYGVPAQWIEGTEKLGGDKVKFRDYLQSTLETQPAEDEMFIPVTEHLWNLPTDINSLYEIAKTGLPSKKQLDKLRSDLWMTCPFKQTK